MFKEGNIPKVEGELYFKDGKRAGWKKHLFGIRTSGFYMSKSGKSMVCGMYNVVNVHIQNLCVCFLAYCTYLGHDEALL